MARVHISRQAEVRDNRRDWKMGSGGMERGAERRGDRQGMERQKEGERYRQI